MDEVDDMFRSFVSDKLKQLGLKGFVALYIFFSLHQEF